MKKLNIALAILVSAVMSGNVVAATNTNYSNVVGYQVQNFNAGNTLHTVTFVKPDLFMGVASSKTANSLVLSSAAFGSYGPVDGYPTHYVKILDGALNGYVFDVVSNTSTSIVVDGSLATSSSTPRFLIREHNRLADVFAESTGLSDGSDTFTLFNSDGSSTVALRASGDSPTGWLNVVTEAPMNPVIYPNQGFLLTTINPGTFRVANTVESTPTVVPLYAGSVNLVSRSNPSSDNLSPTELGVGNNMSAGSDTVEWLSNTGSLASLDVGLYAGSDGFVNVVTEAQTESTIGSNTVLNVTVVQDTTFTAPAPAPRNTNN